MRIIFIVLASYAFIEISAYSWMLFDGKDNQRLIWGITETLSQSVYLLLAFLFVNKRYLAVKFFLVATLGISQIWHTLEVTLCNTLSIITNNINTDVNRSVCENVFNVDYYYLTHIIITLSYFLFLIRPNTAKKYDFSKGSYMVVKSSTTLTGWLFSLFLGKSDHGRCMVIIDSKIYKYKHGKFVGYAAKNFAGMTGWKIGDKDAENVVESLKDTNWSLINNCFLRIYLRLIWFTKA